MTRPLSACIFFRYATRGHMSTPKHVLLFLSILLSLSLNAQVYPVQGNVVLNPPYSPYLADLTALGSQRFWLSLRLQDPTISTYNCKLRLTIEGVGITIRTKNTFLPPPITLEGGGIPQLFYGDDLAAYFNPANLDFAGLTRSQYERTQRLPEGVYRFSIEVLDYNRGTLVSNKIGTTAWIVLNDPPLLNLPTNNTKINILDPTNIPFTWTPRHAGSPNAAFTTNYVFRLIELAPNASSQSANAAFLSQPVLFETTLTQNQFVYGPAEPSLLAGRKYAWQVQATDTEGRDLFRNTGKSEVYVFQYGDALGIPRNVLQQGGNATTLSIGWELPSQGEMPAQYRIRYKPYTSPANNWFESVTTGRYYTLGELNPSTNYIVQVRSERGNIFSEYSAPLQMSTTSLEERPYTCGQAPVLTPPTTTEILPRLFPGDEIRMHDFRMMVLTVEGSNGNFSGTGLLPVSMFNNASVKVRFSGRVNKNYELAGEIVSTYAQGSAMALVVDEMEKIGADRNTGQNNADSTRRPMPVAITITGIIDSVWVQDSVIVVQREDGTQEEIVRPQTADGTMQEVVLTDSVGNSYTVNEAGEVISNGTSATGTVASTVQYKVNFAAKEDQHYGFDAKVHEVLSHYETTSIEGDSYTVPWKSIETGSFDKVKVTATAQREDLLNEVGISAGTESLPKQQGENANELLVTLQGKTPEDVTSVSAYLNQEGTTDSATSKLEVGKLNVISYNKARKRLILISVNGARLEISTASLQTELNAIYKQAVVDWQVEPLESMTDIVYDTDNNGLEYGNSSWFSNYTGEMRTIMNRYLQGRSLIADTYYLFVVDKTDDPEVMGFMPRMKQVGFICSTKVNSSNVTKTIAHELAHGAFRLEHSFPLLPQNGDNLMDYSATGTTLYKTQWDYIHNPVAMLGLFDRDDEGASLCTWWHQNITSNVSPSQADHILEERSALFEYIAENFNTYFELSKSANQNIIGHIGWSARISSFSLDKHNLTLIERFINKVIKETAPNFILEEKGVFLSEYEIEGKNYKVALYSEYKSTSSEKVTVDDLCNLVDNENVKIIIKNNYILISFFKNKMLQMTFQILATEDEDAELWLRYLGILVDSPSEFEVIKLFWANFINNWIKNSDSTQEDGYYGDIVEYPQIAPTSVDNYELKNFKGGIYGCFRRVHNKNSQTERCDNVLENGLYLKHHNGLDIYALPGTELKAVIDGKVKYETSNTLAGNKVKLTGKTVDGKNILYVYCHVAGMQNGLENDDSVKKGDVIAIAGKSGNAANVPFKHCHLTIYIDGEECTNPTDYIKTKFDANGNPDHGKSETLIADEL